jgi:hypothetical protein
MAINGDFTNKRWGLGTLQQSADLILEVVDDFI